MIDVRTSGRDDLEAFFGKSGVCTGKLSHAPILAFVEIESWVVEVLVLDSAHKALGYPDETRCMAQWSGYDLIGKWRSDFFKFTVGELRKYMSGSR